MPERRIASVLRVLRAVGLVVITAGVAWLVIGLRLIFPSPDEIGPADAIVILGPVDDRRLDIADSLLQQGRANILAMAAFTEDFSERYCRESRPDVETLCFHPRPSTTQGEAAWVKAAAEQRGWDEVIVVTLASHTERARFVFDNCLGDTAHASFVSDPHYGPDATHLLRDMAYQSGALVKAIFVTPGCGE